VNQSHITFKSDTKTTPTAAKQQNRRSSAPPKFKLTMPDKQKRKIQLDEN